MSKEINEEQLERALYQLIAEVRVTNGLLLQLADKSGSHKSQECLETDEQAFFTYWQSVPVRGSLPLAFAKQTWEAALYWERRKKRERVIQ